MTNSSHSRGESAVRVPDGTLDVARAAVAARQASELASDPVMITVGVEVARWFAAIGPDLDDGPEAAILAEACIHTLDVTTGDREIVVRYTADEIARYSPRTEVLIGIGKHAPSGRPDVLVRIDSTWVGPSPDDNGLPAAVDTILGALRHLPRNAATDE